MHILISGSFWNEPNVGSGQYLHGLLSWLPRVAPRHRYTLLLPAVAGPGPALPPGVDSLPLRTPFDGRSANLAKLWFEQLAVPQAAALLAADGGRRMADDRPGDREMQQVPVRTTHDARRTVILHVPYFAPPLRCPLPVVTTVGDIIPLRLPEYRGGLHVRAYMALARRAVHRSAHLLTFSAFSRDDIVAHLGIPAGRITPVLLAPAGRYRPEDEPQTAQGEGMPAATPVVAKQEVAARYGLREPFVYYVGGLDARKNVDTLLRAFALLRQQGGPPATLAIAGRALGSDRRLFPDLDGLIAGLDLGDCVRRIDVPFADGPLLYQACTVFAFPSRYEGFGLPPLEAMACGAPVVTSNTSSLPEVVGDAAIGVAPDDVAGWAAALARLLADPALRADLRARGLARAARFSYRQVAAETVRVYEAASTRP